MASHDDEAKNSLHGLDHRRPNLACEMGKR